MQASNCARCGKALAPWETFCTHCGAPRQEGGQAGPQPGPYPAYPAQPAPKPKKQGLPAYAVISLVLASVIFLAGMGLLVWKFFLQPGEGGPEEGPTYLQSLPSRTPASSKTSQTTRETEAPTLPPTTTTPAEEGWLDEDFLSLFSDMVTGYKEENPVLSRWEGPVLIELLGDVTDEDAQCIGLLIDEVNEMDFTPFVFLVEDGGNVRIHYEDRSLFRDIFGFGSDEHYQKSDGFFDPYVDAETGRYFYFNIAINRIPDKTPGYEGDPQGARNHWTRASFMRCLGFVGKSPQLFDSLIEDNNRMTRMGETDRHLLELLYDPRLTTGMPLEEAVWLLTPR